MNKFATLAILLCACLVGTCHGNYGGYGGHGHGHGGHGGYGQESSNGAASAASSSAAASGNEGRRGYERPVEIIAGGPRGGYGQSHEILRPIHLGGGYGGERRGPIQSGGYGGHGHNNNYHRGGYGPRWTVQPAGATLLYPGQNNYRAYVSPPEYSKVILPIRPAAPVAKLFVPENEYGQQGGYRHEGGYRQEGPRGY